MAALILRMRARRLGVSPTCPRKSRSSVRLAVPIALAEAVNEGRVQVGDEIVMVAFGAGFTSGAVTVEWTADPVRGRAGDAAVSADDVRVRLPVDWDSVDPIPEALVELLARPGPVDVPLDDVVPGEPERAHSEVRG